MTKPLERERRGLGTYPHVDIPPDPPFTTTNLCRAFLGRDSNAEDTTDAEEFDCEN